MRTEALVMECERVDKNGDGLVHADDLEDIIHDLLGPSTLNRREINMLTKSLEVPGRGHSRGVDYKMLTDLLEGGDHGRGLRDTTNTHMEERWNDGTGAHGATASARGARRTGSIGEWLHSVSCPAEQRNFRKFIEAMEMYERASGMQAQPNGKGFVVPLGPDLRAQVTFYQA